MEGKQAKFIENTEGTAGDPRKPRIVRNIFQNVVASSNNALIGIISNTVYIVITNFKTFFSPDFFNDSFPD